MHSELTTDLSMIKSNFNQMKSDRENVVLIKTGSFNPIHRSHIANMIKTKEYLENICHFNVLGGFLSPTHDEYVESKLQKEFLPSTLRIEMCQKAIEEEKQEHWLGVDKAEALASEFIDLTSVTLSLQTLLNENIPLSKPIRVIYVAGLDLFNRCWGMNGLRRSSMGGVAVVYRNGQNPTFIQSLINQNPSKLYFISSSNQSDDISSTLIRRRLLSNEDCQHLTYKSVLQYLQFNNTHK